MDANQVALGLALIVAATAASFYADAQFGRFGAVLVQLVLGGAGVLMVRSALTRGSREAVR